MADGLLNKASIILTPTGYKAGTLYNVAPVVEPYEDFDFARASVASRVNSSGLVEMVGRTLSSELVTCGDFSCADPNDYWTLGTGWSIEDGKANVYTASNNRIEQDGIVSDGNTYAITFTILNYNSGSIRLRLGNTYGEYTSGNDTYTQYIQCTTNDKFRIYASSSGADLSITNVSVKEVIDTNNIPRISYDSNGENGHILLEPTSTNLITYSETFENWNEQNSSVTTNTTTSPSGENNASKLVENNADNQHRIDFTSTSSASTVTFSVFLKKDERQYAWTRIGSSGARFDLDNGNISNISADITADSINYGNGWYRYIITKTSASSNEICRINSLESLSQGDYQGDGTSGIYIWGAQLEELSYATSYIPTLTGSTETRATEIATGAGSADLINSTEGVLYAEIAALANDGTSRRISLSNGSISNRVSLEIDETANRIRVHINASLITYDASDLTSFNKIAVKYKVNDYALWLNGVEVATSSSSVQPSGMNVLSFTNPTEAQVFYGKCKALAVFNEALSDAELNNLTG